MALSNINYANIILCLSLILSSLIIHSHSLSELCHPQDKKILLQIKKAFKDPYVLASWDPLTDCCSWYLVTCDEITHRITGVHVHSEGLSGPIPPLVADVPYLSTLIFSNQPALVGPIPPAIARIKGLKSLMITKTGVSGTVPAFLGDLKNLGFLDLSANNLTGRIPSSLGSLPKLSGLRLDRNKLTGPVPASFAGFKIKEFYLYLSHNQLSGTIPAAFKDTDFNYVDLSHNLLVGDPSPLFGESKTVTDYVDLSYNRLSFDLKSVKFSARLGTLRLAHNRITGGIPSSLATVHQLDLSYNLLCGKIPQSMTKFGASAFAHNKCLCGAPLQIPCHV